MGFSVPTFPLSTNGCSDPSVVDRITNRPSGGASDGHSTHRDILDSSPSPHSPPHQPCPSQDQQLHRSSVERLFSRHAQLHRLLPPGVSPPLHPLVPTPSLCTEIQTTTVSSIGEVMKISHSRFLTLSSHSPRCKDSIQVQRGNDEEGTGDYQQIPTPVQKGSRHPASRSRSEAEFWLDFY